MRIENIDLTNPAFTRALTELRPQLDLIPPDRIEPIRHDIVAAISTVMGLDEKLQSFRAEVVAEIGEDAAGHFDLLATSARACGRAHADHLVTLNGADLEEMVALLGEKRSILFLEAQSLVNRKHMSGSLLGELVGGTGYRANALDMLQLVSAFRSEWSAVAERTLVTSAELDEAEALANALLTAVGQNDQADSSSSPSADLRRRAYTFFVRTYDEVRRALAFLRWQAGDADQIAPSLSAGRTHKADDPEDEIDRILAATPTNGAAPIPPGMPGAPPFSPS